MSRFRLLALTLLAAGIPHAPAQAPGPDYERRGPAASGRAAVSIAVPRAALTVEAVIAGAPGGVPRPLLEFEDGSGRVPLQLDVAVNPSALRFRVLTTFSPAPLELTAPLPLLAAGRPHALLLRYVGHRVELFVDGVLMDEEWPMGVLAPQGIAAVRSGTGVEEVRVWRRALADSEIERRAGGAARVAELARAIFGPEPAGLQYWRPRGHNTSAGDAMPFYHDGTFHLYFLLDRRHHRSKWGLGAHQWGHVSSRDLVHWTRHPAALRIDSEDEASICTGSVFFHAGRYYAFYAARQPDRSERLGMAVSPDGIRFEKVLPTPFAEPASPWKRGPNRDPFVFEDGGKFRMLATAELENPGVAMRGGALEQLESADLKNWTPLGEPFFAPGYPGHQPECSDVFEWRGWHYLLFGQDGATRYRISRTPRGPWLKPEADILDGPQARVMKAAEFTGDRRLAVGFIPDGGWGGDVVFRELRQFPDGTLGTAFPAEMIPAAGAPVAWRATPLTPHARVAGNQIRVDAASGYGAAAVDGAPSNFRLRATLTPGRGHGVFGILVRGTGKAEGGLKLEFVPARKRVAWLPGGAGSLTVSPQSTIESVAGLEGPVRVDILVRGDIFDACLNGNRTVVFRSPGIEGARVFIFAHDREVSASGLEIRPLE